MCSVTVIDTHGSNMEGVKMSESYLLRFVLNGGGVGFGPVIITCRDSEVANE